MDDETGIAQAAELFKVLGSPGRLSLLILIDRAPTTVSALVETTGLSQPLVSQYLRTLRQAGLVEADRQGRSVLYRVVDTHVTHVVADALDHVREGHAHHETVSTPEGDPR
ncbi:ArsR/SmtB family transcription factor [Serinibacter salmoneus]|uniref:ArsR/SmtB family transcription factor n=1 Tax=Serinibacter salmoneus TaxID=556530 RepID=UPI001FE8A1C4|nr:metalloregulator ArsR/SmtB family transcription factor [Serinibacter salmoneus]